MLYIVSLGLGEKGISVRGLETARRCDNVYLENYTSAGEEIKDIEKLIGKKVTGIGRDYVESEKIVEEAETKDVCLLVYGDALSATTHIALIQEAMEKGVKYEVVHGASVLSAVGETGLSLYKFGKTGSIPFERKNVRSAYEVLAENDKIKAHTLFLLDLDNEKKKFLEIGEGVNYLIENGMKEKRIVIGCSKLGMKGQKIVSGEAGKMTGLRMDAPCCLIVAGEMNFIEEEMIKRWMK